MGKKIEGRDDIKEVWNFRLSKASPLIDRRTGTWVVHIFANDNPDFDGTNAAQPLESHDTGIEAEAGDERDSEKLKVCYEWLYSVRDKYARDDIEALKPKVAKVEADNAAKAEAGRV